MTQFRPTLAALILAAGYSSRMGQFKPRLPLGDRSAIEHAIESFRSAGVHKIIVVTGHRAHELSSVLAGQDVTCVFNPRYESGMYASVVAGVRALPPEVEACFVLPADMPLVRPSTIEQIADAYQSTQAPVVYPVFQEKRGHPPLVDRRALAAILTSPGTGGLQRVLDQFDAAAQSVNVTDEGIHLDMDVPADYARLHALALSREVLGCTESVCPECLARVEAKRVRVETDVYLIKSCPEHGEFRTIAWRGDPDYEAWGSRQKPATPDSPAGDHACPFECGICAEHRQQTCCVLLEVTSRCNLACSFCFAAAPQAAADPSLETIEGWLGALLAAGGPFNLQLSGGEPTVRNDLAEIIAVARSLGFSFVQLNTNGVRIAKDETYLHQLKAAGLDCVFLQFDGMSDDIYRQIRGKALLQTKQDAVEACAREQLGVVLVPTLVPGVNTQHIGDILRYAVEKMPVVRAVHFQPVSYFGRYPETPSDQDRITLPEVMQQIEIQTKGRIRATDFYPPSAENAYCSFQGKFFREADGQLRALPRPKQSSCCDTSGLVQLFSSTGKQSERAREAVARQWSFPEQPQNADSLVSMNVSSLDAFLEAQRDQISISGMAFQDAWNLDLDRLRDCFIHVMSPDHRLVPLCAYNLTNREGHGLYRAQSLRRSSREVAHV